MRAQGYNAAVDMVDRNIAQGRGDKVAFIDPTRTLTYGALADRAARIGPMLARLGLRREDRIAMMMLDTVDFPIAFWGALRAGVVPVPINTLLPPELTGYILRDSRAAALFVSAPLLQPMRAAVDGAGIARVVVSAPDGGGGDFDAFLASGAAGSDAGPAECSPDEVAFWL